MESFCLALQLAYAGQVVNKRHIVHILGFEHSLPFVSSIHAELISSYIERGSGRAEIDSTQAESGTAEGF